MSVARPESMKEAFGDFDGRVWLNAAHQGPLPRAAVAAAKEAVEQKAAPHRITDGAFFRVPAELKEALAPFIGAEADEVVLGNSTSYGLHLLAHGIRLRSGDEILLVDGDFPATFVPWLWLGGRGVRIRIVEPKSRPLEPAQLEDEISPRTRVFCSSWVSSFTRESIDVQSLGTVCRERRCASFSTPRKGSEQG